MTSRARLKTDSTSSGLREEGFSTGEVLKGTPPLWERQSQTAIPPDKLLSISKLGESDYIGIEPAILITNRVGFFSERHPAWREVVFGSG